MKFQIGQYVNYHAIIGKPPTYAREIHSGPLEIPGNPGRLYMLRGKAGVVAEDALSPWSCESCSAPHPNDCRCE